MPRQRVSLSVLTFWRQRHNRVRNALCHLEIVTCKREKWYSIINKWHPKCRPSLRSCMYEYIENERNIFGVDYIVSWFLQIYIICDSIMKFNDLQMGLSTAGCALVRPLEALVIGMIGGAITMAGTPLFEKLHIDDPVGAITVHGLCGFWVSKTPTCTHATTTKPLISSSPGPLFITETSSFWYRDPHYIYKPETVVRPS